ncbi:hypothetical protein BO443_60258 [Burkholderia orbicola]
MRQPEPVKEPIPAAPWLVCRHLPKQIFSAAEKPFSGADDSYIHTHLQESGFYRNGNSQAASMKDLIFTTMN